MSIHAYTCVASPSVTDLKLRDGIANIRSPSCSQFLAGQIASISREGYHRQCLLGDPRLNNLKLNFGFGLSQSWGVERVLRQSGRGHSLCAEEGRAGNLRLCIQGHVGMILMGPCFSLRRIRVPFMYHSCTICMPRMYPLLEVQFDTFAGEHDGSLSWRKWALAKDLEVLTPGFSTGCRCLSNGVMP